MIVDGNAMAVGTRLAGDICIVGAGPAGIALARKLAAPHTKVVLVESGGLHVEDEIQALNQGTCGPMALAGMEAGRARALGGAGRLWAGQCLPFDPIDFEMRPWVDNSGWPFGPAEIESYVTKAKYFFRVAEDVFDERVYDRFGHPRPLWDPAKLRTMFTVYTPDVDVGKTHHDALKADPHVSVVFHATATQIITNDAGTVASGVECRNWGGSSLTIDAPIVVLCAGGLENPRLLLLSRSAKSKGLGNDTDLVGRFFQDHPNAITASIVTERDDLQDTFRLMYRHKKRYFPKFALSQDAQLRLQVLNANAHLVFEYATEGGIAALAEMVRSLRARRPPQQPGVLAWRIARSLPEVASVVFRRLRGASPKATPSAVHLQCYLEQEPSADSRVELDEGKLDRFGLPTLKVTWDIGEKERRTLIALNQLVQSEFERLGLGDVAIAEWVASDGADWKARLSDCNHHAGTTRMASDPQAGVVDFDSQVFGVKNLYVCGGSTFPTSGYANPTLMIVAMAMRLAEHLQDRARH